MIIANTNKYRLDLNADQSRRLVLKPELLEIQIERDEFVSALQSLQRSRPNASTDQIFDGLWKRFGERAQERVNEVPGMLISRGLEAVSPRTRKGTRVRFSASKGSLVLYSHHPDIGEEGSVTTMPGFGQRTYLPGPGGGLLYVKWDRSGTIGVSPNDVEKVGSLRTGPGRKGQTFERDDVVIETTLHPVIGFDGVGNLHERIAAVLDWPMEDVRSMSLPSLRELVRPVDPALADEISQTIQSGSHITRKGR